MKRSPDFSSDQSYHDVPRDKSRRRRTHPSIPSESGFTEYDQRTVLPKTELCGRCKSIEERKEIESIFEPSSESSIIYLGELEKLADTGCALCRFFLSVASPRKDEGESTSQNIYYGVPFDIPSSKMWGLRGRVLVVITLNLQEPEDLITEDLITEDLIKHVFSRGGIAAVCGSLPTVPELSLSVRALPVPPKAVDFTQLRDWIYLCGKHHAKCKRYADQARKPINLKLIDCEARKIIRNKSSKYVALSYVWGLENQDIVALSVNSPLPQNLFPTIEDAITTTISLGFRYLWIDRYCIDQTNKVEVQEQIGQMNLIYRNAEVTIMAAAGSGPHYGLPGVEIRPRTPRPTVCIGGVQYASVGDGSDYAIRESLWSTRGWTYQEEYFSRRSLYFLEDQVVFGCETSMASESISHRKEDGSSYASTDRDDGEQEAFEILDHLTQYSGRKLSRSTDAIDAVAGVFNDPNFRDGSTPHHFGIPIVCLAYWSEGGARDVSRRRVPDAFLIGLSWQNRQPGKRRNIWPSWSWAEWDVAFDYGKLAGHGEGRRGNSKNEAYAKQISWKPLAEVHIEKPHRTFLNLNDANATDFLASDTTLTHFIRIRSWTCTLDIRLMGSQEIALFGNHVLPLPPANTDCSQNSPVRFYGSFQDRSVGINIPLWPLHSSHSSDSSRANNQKPQFAPGLEQNERGSFGSVMAVLLSRRWLQNGHWVCVMMLVLDKGSHFERVGHCSLYSEDVRRFALRRSLVGETDWPETNHNVVKMKVLNKVMGSFLRWQTVRVG